MKTVRAADGRLVYYNSGGSGKPIIMIHGAGSNHTTWLKTAHALKGMRWAALDCRGHGLTQGEPEIAATVADIIAIADKEKMRSFIIAGICMGGTMAMETAKLHPGRVNKIVIVSPFDKHLIAGASFLDLTCKTARALFPLVHKRRKLSYVDYRIPPKVPFIFTVIADCKGIHARHYGTAVLNCLHRRTTLESTHAPLLVISGTKDIFLRRDLLSARVSKNPQCTWIELDTNHHAITWKPKEVAQLISDFVKR